MTENMIVAVILTVIGAAAVSGQSCRYIDDPRSPFYWKGYENICDKTLCETYPWLQCDVSREFIMDQAAGHWPEDIYAEIEYLQKYFNTLIPQPVNHLPYECKGVCADSYKQLQLERIFADVNVKGETGLMERRRMMCIVIGPNIYYQRCGGKCKMLYGGGSNNYCVPDVTVTIDVWVYCPGATPGCHKVKFDVPLSCSCKRITCKKSLPPLEKPVPVIPPQPKNWKPGTGSNPIDPIGLPLGPINPGSPVDIIPGPIEVINGFDNFGGFPMKMSPVGKK